MGKPRNNPEGLPKRVYYKHGAYHYVDSGGKWHRLGNRWDGDAKGEYAKVSSAGGVAGTVSDLLHRYRGTLSIRLAAGRASPRHVADRTADAAKLSLFFGHMQAAAVKRKHIALYLMHRTDKHGTPAPVRANREIAMLSAAYNWDASLDTNPCLHVPRNKGLPTLRLIKHNNTPRCKSTICTEQLDNEQAH